MKVNRSIRAFKSVAWNTGLKAAVLACAWIVPQFAAAQPAKDAIAGAILTPRYYGIEASGGMKSQDGYKMCFGGDALHQMVEALREFKNDPKALAQLSKGCTMKTAREGNERSFEEVCDEKVGAAFTNHLRVSGTIDKWRQHFEVTMKGLGPNGADKTMISDVVMTYLGDCPVNIKPGQFLKPDGTIDDPTAALGRLGKN
jgi:hypothetical protein